MTVKTVGTDSALNVPPGSLVARVYVAVPTMYTIGAEFEDYLTALAHAVSAKENYLAAQPADSLAPETITIDVRWCFQFPDGGGTDAIMSRSTYETLADARDHLTLLWGLSLLGGGA